MRIFYFCRRKSYVQGPKTPVQGLQTTVQGLWTHVHGLEMENPPSGKEKTITNKKQIKDYGKLHFTGTPSGNV